MSYETRILRNPAEIEEFLPEWEQFLSAGTQGHVFFNDPYTVLAGARFSSTMSPFVVVVECGSDIRAMAPLVIHENRFRLQFSVFQLASFPARTMTLPGNRIVLAAGDPHEACLAKIFETLADHTDEYDLLFLDGIEVSEPLWCHLQSSRSVRSKFHRVPAASDADVAFQTELPPSFDEYLKSLGSSTRKSLKKRTRNLMENAGGRLLPVSQPADVEWLLKQIDEIYPDTWQAKTYGQRVHCKDNEVLRLQSIAKRGWLRSYVLLRGETPLAFQLGFQHGDTYYAVECGFVRAAADCGPGAVLMHLVIRDLIDRDKPRVLDLGHGDSPQKRTFRGVARSVLFVYVVPRGHRHWFITLQRALSRFEATIRNVLIKLKIDNVVRRILKRKKT